MKCFFEKTLKNILIVVVALTFINMGDRDTNTSLDPTFTKLEDDVGSFSAVIYDEDSKIKVHDISFYGKTSVGGVRKESDDSINTLDFSKIKELTIEQSSYISKRYQDKEFVLATAIALSGSKIKKLLIPKNIIICGVELKTGMEKAWFLRDIDRIVIGKERTAADIIDEAKRKKEAGKSFSQKIKDTLKKVSDAISP